MGLPGAVVVGARGMMGAAGAAGEEGATGFEGRRGASYAGTTGPAGPRGPAGEQGFAGESGRQGTTLIGPTGRTGATGSSGVQGEGGQIGERGAMVAGLPGVAGPAGLQGVRGREGSTGEQGVAGVVARWTTYRDFDFDRTDARLRPSEMDQVVEIAAYLVENPSLEVGIDGSLNDGSSRNSRDLSTRRAESVRDALMQAGVPAYKIQMGKFADPDHRREGQIELLIKSRA